MARTTKPLTNTEVKQAKPKGKEFNLNDGNGLALRIKPNGSKLWVFVYYRPYTKKRTSLSFGTFPTISLADARQQKEQARELLAKNIDPKEHRDEISRQNEVAQSNTLRHVANSWLEVKKASVSADHAADTWRSLELHVFPDLGSMPIHRINAVGTIEVLKPIVAKGNLETVKRLSQRLNEIMVFAVNSGLVGNNPLAGIGKAFPSPRKQHLPTLPPDELPGFLKSLSRASIKITTRCLIEWQLHTMVRPGEAAGTRWDEIDLEAALWDIPGKRMKEGKRHIVPLSTQALELLEIMRPISSKSDFVFPSDRSLRKHTNSSTANMAIKRMGYAGALVSHGMRSIASTVLNNQGFDGDIVEAALAHTGKNEVRNAYNRANYLERRKPLMQWWSNCIENASMGERILTGNRGLASIGTG